MEFTREIEQHAAGIPGLWELATQRADRWDAVTAAMEALQPGDPNAETVLRDAAAFLQSLIVDFGHRDWHVTQSHLIYQHAERVFGAGQLKFNKPAVSLSGNGPGASLFHGMRIKYRHAGGL